MSIDVKHGFNGLTTEISVRHQLTHVIPEVGLDQLLQLYVKRGLEAAREKHGCFKYYLLCEASFQVMYSTQNINKKVALPLILSCKRQTQFLYTSF